MLSDHYHRHGDGRRVKHWRAKQGMSQISWGGNLKLFSAVALQMSGSMALRLGKCRGEGGYFFFMPGFRTLPSTWASAGGISPLSGPAMPCRRAGSRSHVVLSLVSLDAGIAALVLHLLLFACAVSALHASLEFERVPFGFEFSSHQPDRGISLCLFLRVPIFSCCAGNPQGQPLRQVERSPTPPQN